MDFKNQISFLKELQKNNSKEWMDANRKWYKAVRDYFIYWLDGLNVTMVLLNLLQFKSGNHNQWRAK
ncbi:MAG: DUF2461 family protein [Flavobacteriaceae bacterium]